MITIQMIDEFRRRTNSSYDDAKYFLERHNGDILEAIIAFEKTSKGHYGSSEARRNDYRDYTQDFRQSEPRRSAFGSGLMRFVQRLFDIKITITDRTERTMAIPVFFPLLMVPIWHILIIAAIAMMMMGFRFSIRESKDDNFNVETIVNRVKEKVKAPRNY